MKEIITRIMKNKTALLFVLLIALSLVPVWLVKTPPLLDYSNILYRAKVISDYSAVPIFSETFQINIAPVPNLIADFLVVLFALAFPIVIAGKLMLSLYIIIFPLGVFYFFNSVRKESNWLAFSAFLFTFNHFFATGLLNYCFSLAILFFSLGFFWKHKHEMNARNGVIMAILAVLAYFAQLPAFAILAFAMLAVSAMELKSEGLKKTVLKLLPLIPALLLLALYAGFSSEASNIEFYSLESFAVEKARDAVGSFLTFNVLLDALLITIPLLILLYIIFKGFAKGEKKLYFLGALLIIVFLLMPYDFVSTVRPGKRLVLPILFILLAASIPCLNLILSERKKQAVKFLLIAFSVFWIASTSLAFLQLNERIEDYFTVFEKLPEQGKLFFNGKEETWSNTNVFSSLDKYYGIFKNGIPSNVFSLKLLSIMKKQGTPSFEIGKEPSKEFCNYYDNAVLSGSIEGFEGLQECFELKEEFKGIKVFGKKE